MRWWLVVAFHFLVVSAEGTTAATGNSSATAPTTRTSSTRTAEGAAVASSNSSTPTTQNSSSPTISGKAVATTSSFSSPSSNSSSPTAVSTECPSLKPPVNGSVSNFTNASAQVSDTGTYSCNEGYNLVGSSTVICQVNGSWTDGTPVCEAVVCPSLPKVGGNVSVTSTTYMYNSTAVYTCQDGFRLNGNEIITCQLNGSWSDSPPECEAVVCSHPPNISSGGSVDFTSTKFNATATYTCEVGYQLKGQKTIQCQVNGNWSDSAPQCDILNCSVGMVEGRKPLDISLAFGSVVEFECDSSYVLYPEQSRVVQCVNVNNNAVNWNVSLPNCGIIPEVELSGSNDDSLLPFITRPKIEHSSAEIVINCTVKKGKPFPLVEWIYSTDVSRKIGNNSNDAVFQRSSGNNVQQLVVNMFNLSYEGSYSCNATNVVGSNTATFEIRLEVVPGRPSKPVNVSVGATNITIEWFSPNFDGHNKIIEYEIEYRLSSNTWNGLSENTAMPNATITSLSPYKDYVFRVRALNGIGYGEFSTESNVIRTAEAKPGLLMGVTAKPNGPKSILVTWNIPSPETVPGVLKQFHVWYNSMRVDDMMQVDVAKNLSSYDIVNLTPYTNYSIQVAAETGAGIGIRSPKEAIVVATDEDRPSASPSITEIIPAATYLTVQWNDVPKEFQNGIITTIEIRYNSSAFKGTDEYVNASGSLRSMVINELEEFVDYGIQIRAYTSAGPSTLSASRKERTLAAPSLPPAITNVITTGSTSLSVIWDPPSPVDLNGVLVRYEVQLQVNGSTSGFSPVKPGPGTNTSFNISGLERWTYYAIRVRVISHGENNSDLIDGKWSNIKVVRTDESIPEPPANVSVRNVSSTSVKLVWALPQNSFGDILRYVVEYNGTFDNNSTRKEVEGLRSYVATHLHPFSRYDFKVFAVTSKGQSETGRMVSTMTLQDTPTAPPRDLNVVARGNDDPAVFELTWKAVEEIHINGILRHYLITYGETKSSDVLEKVTNETTLKLTGLKSYTNYSIQVSAVTISAGVPTTPRVELTNEAAPSAAPRNFTVNPVGYDKSAVLKLSWLPVDPEHINGILRHYVVRYTEDLQPSRETNITTVETTLNLTGLKPFTNYTLRVLAFTVAEGVSTNRTRQLTNEAPPSAPPSNFEVVSVGNTAPAVLRLLWEPVNKREINGRLTEYKVYYQEGIVAVLPPPSELNGVTIEIVRPNETSFDLSNLKAYTNYSVWMLAVTVEDGERTQPLIIETNQSAPSDPPGDFRVEAIGNDEHAILRVHWTMPSQESLNGKLKGYKVRYKEEARTDLRRRDDGYREKLASPLDVSLNLTDLKPYTNYTVSMLAYTVMDGASTHTVTKRTNAARPPNIIITPVEPLSIDVGIITIQFENGFSNINANGPILEYQILAAVFQEGKKIVNSTDLPVEKYIPPGEAMKDSPYAYVIANYTGTKVLPKQFTAGGEKDSFTGQEVFNGPLRSDVAYNFFVRAFTQGENERLETRSNYVFNGPFKTKKESDSNAAVVIVVVVLVIILLVIVLIIIMVMVYRRRQKGGFELVQGGSIPMETIIENVGAAEDIFKPPGKINVSHLLVTVNRLHADGDFMFSDEYEHVEHPDKHTFMTVAANAPENRTKNRYTNINSYDHSRVHLHASSAGVDYINANHVDAYGKEKAFIATQGPVPDSISDFWRMLWEQNSHVIVMLTKLEEGGRLKCHQYWPDSETQYYDDICVTPIKAVTELPDYVVRKFSVKAPGTKEERIISLWHYLMWPDHGVPQHPYSLLNFIRKSSNANPSDAGPIIVHCSAGVGRTGTYIALYSLWKMMINEGKVDVFGTVQELRRQRCMMVQTESQYVFVYEALLDLVHCGDTEIAPQDLADRIEKLDQEENDSRESAIEAEFKRLNGPRSPRLKCTAANLPYNQSKNRFVTVVPYDETRVRLSVVPGVEGSDYINASWLNSYWHRNAYIATQAPLPDTVNDFWRMISENNASTIVMLTNLSESGREMCAQYWPARKQEYEKLVVEKTSEEPYEEYTQRDFMITDEDGQSVPVRQFQYTAWPQRGAPHIGIGMTDMIGQVERWKQQAGDGSVVVHCSAGAGRTGCFIALSILLDQLKTEGIVDVFQTIRGLRLRRSAMVQTLDQYRYCYSTILDFLASYDNYSNFK